LLQAEAAERRGCISAGEATFEATLWLGDASTMRTVLEAGMTRSFGCEDPKEGWGEWAVMRPPCSIGRTVAHFG
jgi:hypothetical protein